MLILVVLSLEICVMMTAVFPRIGYQKEGNTYRIFKSACPGMVPSVSGRAAKGYQQYGFASHVLINKTQ